MRKELKYFLGILSIFSLSIYFLTLLLKKYATLTFEHFLVTCRVIASSFFSTGAHYIGFLLTAIVLTITLGFFLKTLFSYIKTKRKLGNLLQKQIFSLPKKLKIILKRNGIRKDLIIIVENSEDYAFTVDWFSPKIVLSFDLLNRLSNRQLEAVVLHEYYHSKNKHPLLLITSEILSSSLILLPILKELTKKMRIVLEEEADGFVFGQQRTTKYLNLALEIVSSQDRFKIYPNFSRRNDYKIKKFNLLVSVAVILAGFFLFKFPGDTHAIQASENSYLSNCGDNLCSSHCPTSDPYHSSNINPVFQTTSASFKK